jgi:thiosulfate reductase/polysulfide reductase chain A
MVMNRKMAEEAKPILEGIAMSRRTFVKATALSAAAAALGSYDRLLPDHLFVPVEAAPAAVGEKTFYQTCEFCGFRCGILVKTEDGIVKSIEGNPAAATSEGKLCPKGVCGVKWIYDPDRLKYPMIRDGPRGSGQWRRVSWDEALTYVADKLKNISATYGPQSVAFTQHCNSATPFSKRFCKSLGTPNLMTHHSTCKTALMTAAVYTFGTTETPTGYGNADYILMFGRNTLETPQNAGTRSLMKVAAEGAKLVVLDPRLSVTASKGEWIPIKPGTDQAFALAMANVIINEELYDKEFVETQTYGFEELKAFIQQYPPEWAAPITEVPASTITRIAREFATASKPLADPGWHATGYTSETQLRRSILILNGLVGSIGKPWGVFFKTGPKFIENPDLGAVYPKITASRVDGTSKGGTHPLVEKGGYSGMWHMLPSIIMTGKDTAGNPYPIKAWIMFHVSPVTGIPDRDKVIEAFEKLDLSVVIDTMPTDSAWYADVILPECTYLERTDPIRLAQGGKPGFPFREACVEPMYESKPSWWIFTELAKKMGLGSMWNFTIEEFIAAQIAPQGVTFEELKSKGWILFPNEPGIPKDGFATPTKKFEFYCTTFKEHGYDPLPTWTPPQEVPAGQFRLIHGRCALSTHAMTQNNEWLAEIVPENELWINTKKAASLGIKNGDYVTVENHKASGKIKAKVTEGIREDCVFMLHGWGARSQMLSRAYNKGLNDGDFIDLKPEMTDPIGGAYPLMEVFVSVHK